MTDAPGLLRGEPDREHVAVLDDVVAALDPQLPELTGAREGARLDELVPADHLCSNEASLHVGVNLSGGVGRGASSLEASRAHLGTAHRGEEGDEAEQLVCGAHDLL